MTCSLAYLAVPPNPKNGLGKVGVEVNDLIQSTSLVVEKETYSGMRNEIGKNLFPNYFAYYLNKTKAG